MGRHYPGPVKFNNSAGFVSHATPATYATTAPSTKQISPENLALKVLNSINIKLEDCPQLNVLQACFKLVESRLEK